MAACRRWVAAVAVLTQLCSAAAAAPQAPALAPSDLSRARRRVPRPSLRAPTFAGASGKLNAALRAGGWAVRDCSEWTVEELNRLLGSLLRARSPALAAVYHDGDNRRLRYPSAAAAEAAWAAEVLALERRPELRRVVRDGKCHEAVMLHAHHLPTPARAEAWELPTLPRTRHYADAARGRDPLVDTYLDNVGCWVCHGDPNAPRPERAWAPGTPSWPPVQVPVFRNQWTADITGWEINSRFPKGLNVTGTWHYDYLHNRVRQDYLGHATGSVLPLKTNTTLFWFADPAPADDMNGTFTRGRFYAVVRPFPGVIICSWIAYPTMSILRPDAFAKVMLDVGGPGSDEGAQYVTRENVDGRWADFWRFPFTDPVNASCDGNFTLWYDIEQMRPVRDSGPNDCVGGMAESNWDNFRYAEPDPGLFSVFDFTGSDAGGRCKPSSSLESLYDDLPPEAAATVEFAVQRFGGPRVHARH